MSPQGIGPKALRYWEAKQAAVANNLANASTPGFKGERVFARYLQDAQFQVDSGSDFGAGSVNPTGRPLDVALVGEGFLVVEGPAGPRWLRGGSLEVDPNGTLRDGQGHAVLGEQGRIVVPPGDIEITSIGEVLVDGELHGRMLIERPAPGIDPTREGSSLWVPSAGAQRVGEGDVKVRQGHIEGSNVDPIRAMVEMIEIQRAYTAVQKSMLTEDDVMGTITSEIGRVAG
jgi:flagellar basal body rod protein FlgG